MKVTIVTIYDHFNLGNRLQNYSVQTVLENMGFSVETIQFFSSKLTTTIRIKNQIQKIFKYKLPGDAEFWKLEVPRQEKFEKFNKMYINTKYTPNVNALKSTDSDYWVVGSDQVWNVGWYLSPEIERKMYFLTFVERDKKICFSPSFGVNHVPEESRGWLNRQLKDFRAISVREDAGAKIVKELTGIDAEILIDPTLMLNAKEWDQITRPVSTVSNSKPYILTYFLGDKTEEVQCDIQSLAEKNNLAVYNLLDKKQPEIYAVGPSEFLYLVSHAQLVLTDSFHACVFSFLYQKPFVVYERKGIEIDMSSRIDTFLGKFDLDRKRKANKMQNELFEADYSNGFSILEKERQKVNIYLNNAMSVKTEN